MPGQEWISLLFLRLQHSLAPLLTKSSLARVGASVSRALQNYLDQQRVALPRWNTLDLLIKPLGFYHLKVHHVMDTTAITLVSMM